MDYFLGYFDFTIFASLSKMYMQDTLFAANVEMKYYPSPILLFIDASVDETPAQTHAHTATLTIYDKPKISNLPV